MFDEIHFQRARAVLVPTIDVHRDFAMELGECFRAGRYLLRAGFLPRRDTARQRSQADLGQFLAYLLRKGNLAMSGQLFRRGKQHRMKALGAGAIQEFLNKMNHRRCFLILACTGLTASAGWRLSRMAEHRDGIFPGIAEGGHNVVYNLGFLGSRLGLEIALTSSGKVLSTTL